MFPGNTRDFLEYVIEVTNLDLIPTSWIEGALYYLPEPEPFNINFEAVGIETKLLLTNIGSIIWTTLGFFVLALITLVFKKV